LNGKEGASLQKAGSVGTSDQAAHEINADIFLPWHSGGERNACQQVFNQELAAIAKSKTSSASTGHTSASTSHG
jgi:hypothetical protein